MYERIFTFIIFSENLKQCKRTMKSLKEQTIDFGNIQTIVINCDESIESNRFQKEISAQNDSAEILHIDDSNRNHILEDALKLVNGTYTCVTKSGVTYSSTALQYVDSYMKESNENAAAITIKADNKPYLLEEHNSYGIQFKEKTNLELNYKIVLTLFPAFFIRSESLSQEVCSSHEWNLSVLKLLFFTICGSNQLGFVTEAVCKCKNTDMLLETWLNKLNNKEGRALFQMEFLNEIFLYTIQKKNSHVKNAKYNLLYYCSILGMELKYNDIFEEDYIKENVNKIIDFIKEQDLIINNKYIPRLYKRYFLNHFSWDEVDNPSDIILKENILNQEYDTTKIYFIKVEKEYISIEGSSTLSIVGDFDIYLKLNNKMIPCDKLQKEINKTWFGEKIGHSLFFIGKIPISELEKENKLTVVCKHKEELAFEIKTYTFGQFAPLSVAFPLYFKNSNFITIYDKKENAIIISRNTIIKTLKQQLKLDIALLSGEKYAKKAFAVRKMFRFFNNFKTKQVWLLSDRINRADDNGEVLFRYLSEQKLKGIKLYFVIGKDSADYERMKQYGAVVDSYSWKHKLLHLMSDYVISSHGNAVVSNPFRRYSRCYKDIMINNRFVFLQHGITKDDQSAWLNRYNKNIYGLVVTTKPEYDSMFEYDYYYEPEHIWLTGMPRYDFLYHDEKKYITIIPTWRKAASGGLDDVGVWLLGEQFFESEYFKFYNALLNDKTLLKKAKEFGYTICFMPHPNIISALPKFGHAKEVIFFDETKIYREMFAETNLMITDYSSVAFDFAYLRKPMIYCQFDKEEFFSGEHSYTKGYFDYDRDGFGEVEETLNGTVNRIIEYMQNGCELKEEYRRRIDETFAFHDSECCKRVVEKLVN